MNYRWTLAAAAVLAASQFGCHSNTADRDLVPKGPINEAQRPLNTAMVQEYEVAHVSAAVIREHTLYPYHFVENSVALNELGWRDLHLLAAHFASNPGPLNVRKGDTPEVLYKARIKSVIDAMSHEGVQSDRIKVTDGLPGGDGISSDKVVLILDKEKAKAGIIGGGDKSKTGGTQDSNKSPNSGTGTGTGMHTGGSYK